MDTFCKGGNGCLPLSWEIDIGGQPFSEVMKGIELFAGKVAPFIMASK